MALMPKLHDRVLLTLSCLGFAVVFSGGFLNHAQNRLAKGVAYSLFQAPAYVATAAMAGFADWRFQVLCGARDAAPLQRSWRLH